MSHDILYRDMSVTYCTRIWLLSWMSLLLILKPTCFRKCLMTYFTGICLWHTVQGYGFSPERVFCWSLNLHALENVSRHSLQGYVSRNSFSPEIRNSFSPKMTSPLKMVSPQKMAFFRNIFVGSRYISNDSDKPKQDDFFTWVSLGIYLLWSANHRFHKRNKNDFFTWFSLGGIT